MSGAFVLVSGELFREPPAKVSKSGKDYCTGTLKVADGDGVAFWSLVEFGDAATELARLAAGEALSAQGRLKTETYEKDGQTRISLSVMANNILALRAPKKAKAPKATCANAQVEKPAPAPAALDDGFPTEGPWR